MTRDGQEFYQWAAEQKVSAPLRAVFLEMGREKTSLAAELGRAVLDRGAEPSNDGTLAGSLRRLYAEVRAALAADKGRAVAAQLEEGEDDLLQAFERARERATDAEVRALLERFLPRVRAAHDRMKQLKDALAAA
jgi:uncharacterized protein (TIGR02284 family)